MKQIVLATHNAQDTYKTLPPQYGRYGTGSSGSFGTVLFHILPFIEQNALYQKSTVNGGPNYAAPYTRNNGSQDLRHSGIEGSVVPIYLCPTDDAAPGVTANWGWSGASYAGNFRVFGNLTGTTAASVSNGTDNPNINNWHGRQKIQTIPDGSSNTIFFAEKIGQCNSTGPYPGQPDGGNMWTRWDWLDYWQPTFAAFITGPGSKFQSQPTPWTRGGPCNPRLAQSLHSGVINVALGDGSVRTLNSGLTGDTWWALCTPATGDIPGSDFN